jgi:polysaccharide pyruvyl transferase WcaK-like protein
MRTTSRRLRIGISGSYGGMNLGDEAILDGILSQLRATVPADITVFSRNPSDTLARHNIERAVPVRSLTRREITPEVENLDLLMLGGGGILYDRDAEAYLREVFLAHELGIPVILYAISAGPLTLPASRRAVAEALNAAASPVITVVTDSAIASLKTSASPSRSTSPPTPHCCSNRRNRRWTP